MHRLPVQQRLLSLGVREGAENPYRQSTRAYLFRRSGPRHPGSAGRSRNWLSHGKQPSGPDREAQADSRPERLVSNIPWLLSLLPEPSTPTGCARCFNQNASPVYIAFVSAIDRKEFVSALITRNAQARSILRLTRIAYGPTLDTWASPSNSNKSQMYRRKRVQPEHCRLWSN